MLDLAFEDLILLGEEILQVTSGLRALSGSPPIFPPLDPNQPFPQGLLVSLNGEKYLETKMWLPGVLIVTEASLLLNPFDRDR